MIKYMFMVLLSIHVLGDFYFQTEVIAQKKKEKLEWVLLHSVIYAAISGVLFLIVMPGLPNTYLWTFVISHGIVDILKFFVCNKFVKVNKRVCSNKNIFLIDQIIHLIIIVFIAYDIRGCSIEALFSARINHLFATVGISGAIVLSWTVKMLLLHKPANIFISNVLEQYKPQEHKCDMVKDKNAGRFVGTLERIIMTIFITMGQYSVVGLVLTAKSITRYNRISEDPEFAEYYLLGTLLSTICAICISILF